MALCSRMLEGPCEPVLIGRRGRDGRSAEQRIFDARHFRRWRPPRGVSQAKNYRWPVRFPHKMEGCQRLSANAQIPLNLTRFFAGAGKIARLARRAVGFSPLGELIVEWVGVRFLPCLKVVSGAAGKQHAAGGRGSEAVRPTAADARFVARIQHGNRWQIHGSEIGRRR
jgi:hypothetical protein